MGLTIPKHTLSTLLFFTHTYPRPDSKMGVTHAHTPELST